MEIIVRYDFVVVKDGEPYSWGYRSHPITALKRYEELKEFCERNGRSVEVYKVISKETRHHVDLKEEIKEQMTLMTNTGCISPRTK